MSFASLLRCKEILHRTDNQKTEIILSIGSHKSNFHNIHLAMEWISRDLNGVADELSRIEDSNDYKLDPSCFAYLDRCLGPHTVNRFSSVKTRQLDRFCSRFLDPGCEAFDAFTVSWAGDYNWLFPPPYLGSLCFAPHVR